MTDPFSIVNPSKVTLTSRACVDVLPASVKSNNRQNRRQEHSAETYEHEHQQHANEQIHECSDVKSPTQSRDLPSPEELGRTTMWTPNDHVMRDALPLWEGGSPRGGHRLRWVKFWVRVHCKSFGARYLRSSTLSSMVLSTKICLSTASQTIL